MRPHLPGRRPERRPARRPGACPRAAITALALLATASACLPALGRPPERARLEGHWEGRIEVPGAPQPMVLDLAADGPGGSWRGGLTLPGRGVRGAPLQALVVTADHKLVARTDRAFGGPPQEPPPALRLRAAGPDGLTGEWQQAGHRAPVRLQRQGAPRLERPVPPATVPPGLAGIWRGSYELGGHTREVTLTLTPGAASPGQLLIVGRRRTELALDGVEGTPRHLTLAASAAGLQLEGRWDEAAGRFDGLFVQGPFEAALVLRRDPAEAPAAPAATQEGGR